MYTGLPLVFTTGSHSNVIEVNVMFVKFAAVGAGGVDPSPTRIEEKFFTTLKNSQLLRQLLLFLC